MSPHVPAGEAGNRATASPAMFDVEQLAELLGVSPRHVRRLADAGKCPPAVRLGKCARWPRHVVETWIADGCPNCRKRPGVTR